MKKHVAPALLLAATACVPAKPPARPTAAPPPSVATAVVPPAATDWRDIPLTPGGWTYARQAGGSSAGFGAAGAPPLFTVTCMGAQRRIMLARAGAPAASLTITTSYAPFTLPMDGGEAILAATDRRLDQIAFSRGRFTVEAAGLPTLVLPAWAEPGRVIEDCRGPA